MLTKTMIISIGGGVGGLILITVLAAVCIMSYTKYKKESKDDSPYFIWTYHNVVGNNRGKLHFLILEINPHFLC